VVNKKPWHRRKSLMTLHPFLPVEICWMHNQFPPERTEQEPVPPPWWPAVENILTEYGLQAIDFVADFKQALARTQEPWCMKMNDCKTKCEDCPVEVAQRTWVGLTDDEQQLRTSNGRTMAGVFFITPLKPNSRRRTHDIQRINN
jgi:hypothetical protein